MQHINLILFFKSLRTFLKSKLAFYFIAFHFIVIIGQSENVKKIIIQRWLSFLIHQFKNDKRR